jgi:2-polyprenyl-3-methyl-5-hydroxy-6-metoxy-1,4-benzoquinol methylase
VSMPEEKYSKGKSPLRRALFLGPHTCPWWFGYSFDNPLRRFVHDPVAILGEFVAPGQTVVDIGCGLGYFSLALAKLVGPSGRVVALDVQPQMVRRARSRAECQGLADRIDFHICTPNRLGLTNPVDFVLAFWVVHEVADPEGLLNEVSSFLRPHGRLLIAEPKGHVSAARFAATVELAHSVGYHISEGPLVRFSRTVVCSPLHGEDRPKGPIDDFTP